MGKIPGSVLPDAAVRAHLQRVIGTSLHGSITGDKQAVTITTGTGANEKTTAIEAITFALGDYATAGDPTLLLAKSTDGHPAGIADLLGRCLVSVSEIEQDRRFDLAVLKRLTGGETSKARFMRQNFFQFTPSHLLIMSTNHLPRIDDDTEAVWRRIRVVPFTVQIPQGERDPELPERLRAEADAILSWTVGGWKDYRANGLQTPDAVPAETDRYKDDSDAVGRFIADECLTGGACSPYPRHTPKDVYTTCVHAAHKPLTCGFVPVFKRRCFGGLARRVTS